MENKEESEQLLGLDDDIVSFQTHLRIASEWLEKNYDDIDEVNDDLMVEAGLMFDKWGLGQNQQIDMNCMIDALDFIICP